MNNLESLIKQQFEEAYDLLQSFMEDAQNQAKILSAVHVLAQAFKSGKKVISCGNGGSMCDAMHFAEELSGRFRDNRPALPAIAISDVGYLSCVGNDYGYENVFARFLEAMGQSGDVLLAISTSGNSPNVLKAIHTAKQCQMKVIGLTGRDGGSMSALCDIEIRAPYSIFADRAQEIHIKVIHCLILGVEQLLFTSDAANLHRK